MPDTFAAERDRETLAKIKEQLRMLPPFCAEFFRGISATTLPLTRYGYALDLRVFFTFLVDEFPPLAGKTIHELTLADIARVASSTIEEYLDYLTYGTRDGEVFENHDRGKARKLSSLRAFYRYFCKNGKLPANVAAIVDAPKLREQPITRLEPNEVANLLDMAENGAHLTEKQRQFHQRTRVRDVAILTLFLGTGIRISELVGLNMGDVDFDANAFRVTRKGGKGAVLYFGDEVREALLRYFIERKELVAQPGSENALFLSLQSRRLSTRAVQNLVEKYAQPAVPLKHISPHKQRSTYGTMLYHETGDIYLVADVLGHNDVNTTRKHYAAQKDENRRRAARVVKLRE